MNEYKNKVHEIPMHSNRGPRVEYYQTFDFLKGGGYAWCVDLFLACWANAGHPLPYKTAGAFDMDNWARRHKWSQPLVNLIPGDGICIGPPLIRAGHYCMYLDHTKTQVETLNGNVHDSVDVMHWPRTSIRGCMHVPEVINVPKIATKPPLFVVVTSINGHKQVIVTQRTWEMIVPLLPKIIKNRGWNGFTIKRVR
jgi:hypothetical protein